MGHLMCDHQGVRTGKRPGQSLETTMLRRSAVAESGLIMASPRTLALRRRFHTRGG
jgi:hypothetical protein